MLLPDFSKIWFGNTVIFLKLSRKCRDRAIDKARQFLDISVSRCGAPFFGIFRKVYGLIYRENSRRVPSSVSGIFSMNGKCSGPRRRIAGFIVVFSITFLRAGR